MIGKINRDRTKSVKFYDGPYKKILDLAKIVQKADRDNRNKKFVYLTTDRQIFDFNEYTNLFQLGFDLYSDKLSLDDVKNKQKC